MRGKKWYFIKKLLELLLFCLCFFIYLFIYLYICIYTFFLSFMITKSWTKSRQVIESLLRESHDTLQRRVQIQDFLNEEKKNIKY